MNRRSFVRKTILAGGALSLTGCERIIDDITGVGRKRRFIVPVNNRTDWNLTISFNSKETPPQLPPHSPHQFKPRLVVIEDWWSSHQAQRVYRARINISAHNSAGRSSRTITHTVRSDQPQAVDFVPRDFAVFSLINTTSERWVIINEPSEKILGVVLPGEEYHYLPGAEDLPDKYRLRITTPDRNRMFRQEIRVRNVPVMLKMHRNGPRVH